MIIKNLLIFFYDFIFFGGSWVGATMMRPPSLKKRLGGRRPPSKTLGWAAPYLQHIPATYPSLTYPSIAYPTLTYPTLTYPTLTYPTLTYPTLTYPTFTYPTLTNPTLAYSIST